MTISSERHNRPLCSLLSVVPSVQAERERFVCAVFRCYCFSVTWVIRLKSLVASFRLRLCYSARDSSSVPASFHFLDGGPVLLRRNRQRNASIAFHEPYLLAPSATRPVKPATPAGNCNLACLSMLKWHSLYLNSHRPYHCYRSLPSVQAGTRTFDAVSAL